MSVRAAPGAQRKLMLAVVAVGALFVLFFPARQLVHQRRDIASLEERLGRLRSENDRLARDVKRLSDPEQLEVLARERLGLVKPGERAYLIEPVRPKGAGPAVHVRVSWLDRTWDWLSSILRGRD